MISKDTADNLIAILTGMLLFKSITYMNHVEGYINEYKYIVFAITLIIFFNRRWILSKIYS